MSLAIDWRADPVVVRWKGQEIGRFEHRGECRMSGQARYGGETFDTDDYSLDGVPNHWIAPKVAAMCKRAERGRRAA